VAVLEERDLERVSVASPRIAPRKIPEPSGLPTLLPLGLPIKVKLALVNPSRSQSGEGGEIRSDWSESLRVSYNCEISKAGSDNWPCFFYAHF